MKTWIIFLILTFSFGISHPSVQASEIEVVLGEKFRLGVGDVASIKSINARLYFKKFPVYQPIRKGVIPEDWATELIEYEFHVNAKTYTHLENRSAAPYDIWIWPGDQKTYAEFTIKDPVALCMNSKESGCWHALAQRFVDVNYCRKIPKGKGQDACIEYILDEINQPELCAEVQAPMMYCQYLKATQELDPVSCAAVIRMDYLIKCYKEIAAKTNEKGTDICKHLANNKEHEVRMCVDIMSGVIKY